ncbi:MAG: insulinase family protein, partial [Pisciglobus halotolerans]|nr:insulinase family protein [Pisciglobus halotolerans]
LYDDKQAYASLALQELLFEDKDQQVPGIGIKEDLENITARSLYDYYHTMIQEDEVDIYVMGSVDEDKITEYFKEFPFKKRNSSKETPFYKGISATKFHQKTEKQEITQAKFNLGYAAPIYYHKENYYAGQVFNGLFGGFPHSKLFMNVREKESLAYYASSSLDTFRGMMVVQTGIDSKEVDKVRDIIAEQLDEMQKGNFSDVAFLQTKSMLKNQLIQSEDNPGGVIERIYSGQLVSENEITLEEWLKGIEETTREEVIAVAKQIELKGIFFLSGGKNNGEN